MIYLSQQIENKRKRCSRRQKMKKCIKRVICLLFVCMLLIGIIYEQVDSAKSKISLNKKSVSLKVGNSVKLSVRGTKKKVSWSSTSPYVATVSRKGVVRAKKTGETKIVAKVVGKKLICRVRVISSETNVASETPIETPTAISLFTATPSVTSTPIIIVSPTPTPLNTEKPTATPTVRLYTFRYHDRLTEHYKKHGIEMGFSSEEEYLAAANAVIQNPNALHKLEAEDDDHVYFIETTGEIVFLSQDGYIRTYFIADRAYYDKQSMEIAA